MVVRLALVLGELPLNQDIRAPRRRISRNRSDRDDFVAILLALLVVLFGGVSAMQYLGQQKASSAEVEQPQVAMDSVNGRSNQDYEQPARSQRPTVTHWESVIPAQPSTVQPAKPAKSNSQRYDEALAIMAETREIARSGSSRSRGAPTSRNTVLALADKRCNHLAYGTVSYRNCRGDTWQHLRAKCADLRRAERLHRVSDDDDLRENIRLYCEAERLFRVVN